ncbi:MAG: hypothetical protein VKK99_04775 [Cyanobacteriota bacterium]|nr:hypothetical protein [Cyanobacteriota bacterium]
MSRPGLHPPMGLGMGVCLASLLSACMGPMPMPLGALNGQLAQEGSHREPSLSGQWLALIANRSGRDQVELVNVERQRPVPLPGLNRPDALPLSVSVDGTGDRLAVVRQVASRTELVLYRRSLMHLEIIPMAPAGVPRRASLRADGREIALEVSRNGRVEVDLIQVP